MSEAIKFDYPAEFEIKVWVVNDETGQKGQTTISLGNFELPTKEKIQSHLDGLHNELKEAGAGEFRLATKREAWDAVCIEKTGTTFAMPKGEGWD